MEIKKRVLVAMSGGGDSSVAAYILKSRNFDCIGAMMKLYEAEDTGKGRGCCGISDTDDARSVAAALGIPFYVLNFTDIFKEEVIERFVRLYGECKTPNPCLDCNRYVKFKHFLSKADELDAEYIATGHYARCILKNGRYLLAKGLDESKDQSYFLYSMTQYELSRTLFPLSFLTKEDVRNIAQEQGLVNAEKRESQDICFIPDGDYAKFICGYTNENPTQGCFVNEKGKVLGNHRGLIHYTIGQRKGLGLSNPNPLFVLKLIQSDNTVVVGESEKLYEKSCSASDINLIPFDEINGKITCQAKIRYAHKPAPATIWQTGDDSLHVEFDKPQRAITPGQAIVFYHGEICLGGGTINAVPYGSSNP